MNLPMTITVKGKTESQRIYERLRGAFDEELKTMARFMASKPNHQLFGQTEFELRDRVHELGARVLETAREGTIHLELDGETVTSPEGGHFNLRELRQELSKLRDKLEEMSRKSK